MGIGSWCFKNWTNPKLSSDLNPVGWTSPCKITEIKHHDRASAWERELMHGYKGPDNHILIQISALDVL